MRRKAMFYTNNDDLLVCSICPHECKLKNRAKGICGVRRAADNEIELLNYGEISSIALDPIEKKPLFHFKPDSCILSVGSYGCNFRCGFCQNYSISMEKPDTRYVGPEELIKLAEDTKKQGNIGIAFTYNEPSIWYEYVYDVSKMAENKDLDIVLVTNGYIKREPLEKILPFVDAMNIDLKSYNSEFYKKICAGTLENVLETIEIASKKCHVEITTLLVNGYNDSDDEARELARWLSNVNADIPLHMTRYHPMYKFTAPATPVERILRCREIAKEYLSYVYVGNVYGADDNTYCPECGEILIEREGYKATLSIKEDRCPKCGRHINVVL